MPRFTNLVSLVSLVSLASIARCRPVLDNNAAVFTFDDGPFLDPPTPFQSDGTVPEIPQGLGEGSFGSTSLNVPLGTVSNFYAETLAFVIAGGGLCRIPSLSIACCPVLSFESSNCVFGNACGTTDVSLCCEQGSSGGGTPTNCEPPKVPPVGHVANFDNSSPGELFPFSNDLGNSIDEPSFPGQIDLLAN